MSDVTSDYRTLVKSRHYIDLPGEPPKSKLWPGVNNLIILRKHRDVVFDIKLGNGATYTVTTDRPQSEYGRFYDPKRNLNVTKVTFKDGEPCHLWLGRTFQGSLILKQGDKLLGRYPIRKMDYTQGCTEDPKDKPAPIIIAMGLAQKAEQATTVSSSRTPQSPEKILFPRPTVPGLTDDSLIFDQSLMQEQLACRLPIKLAQDLTVAPPQEAHIVEVDARSIPEELLDAVAAGGSDETAIDNNKIATRNWLFGQLGGALGFFSDNKEWIREIWSEKFRLMKIVHKNAGERWYVVLTGNPRLRKYLTAARYGAKNEKVLTIAGGAGTLESGAAAAWEASKGAFKKAGLLALIFTVALDTAEWLHDYQQIGPDGKPKKDFADLLGKIGIDLAKAGLSAALASIAVGAVIAFLGTTTLPVWGIVVGTIAIAVGIGYGLDLIDKKTEATGHFTSGIRWLGKSLKDSAEYLEKAMPNDYQGYSLMYMP
ncbi:hypothetical protein FAZ95_29290 [Trinickia violacea]|uniref:Uncharacterized protein n=1 Tax=Trinickia violacea TaxID=2571746 RepID=A0A4V1EIB3_9BURK|nr:hypothetical protein [Trinickia violacea]QCP53170.1 hypothetical protein FAZ95_29290 [Trinickia violacea]